MITLANAGAHSSPFNLAQHLLATNARHAGKSEIGDDHRTLSY